MDKDRACLDPMDIRRRAGEASQSVIRLVARSPTVVASVCVGWIGRLVFEDCRYRRRFAWCLDEVTGLSQTASLPLVREASCARIARDSSSAKAFRRSSIHRSRLSDSNVAGSVSRSFSSERSLAERSRASSKRELSREAACSRVRICNSVWEVS